MSGYRKRKSSDSLEGDRKRISNGCYNYPNIKREYDVQVSNKHGRQQSSSNVSVPYNYTAPIASSASIQSAVVYNNSHLYGQPYKSFDTLDNSNGMSSIRNYGYDDDLSEAYNNRRQMNFVHENYINSLRQSAPRAVNFNDLRRRLSEIDIRYVYNWKFASALDLTIELESSLKYFVDTRNELVFLRKLQRQQWTPFSYNEINIANRNGMQNRMRFLEAESAYRSNRMNLLFHQLQNVVIPSIIDDIRYVHSVVYEKSWVNRARYWFSLFKQIRWENTSRYRNDGVGSKFSRKHRRSRRNYSIKDEEFGVGNNVNIKSETIQTSIDVKVENVSQIQAKKTTLRRKETENPNQTVSNTVDGNNNAMLANGSELTASSPPVAVVVETKANQDDVNDQEAAKDSEQSNSSIVIVEPNVSVVSVTDDDRPHDASDNVNPPEGDTKN